MQLKETSFFDALSEQWLRKCLPVLFVFNACFSGKQSQLSSDRLLFYFLVSVRITESVL